MSFFSDLQAELQTFVKSLDPQIAAAAAFFKPLIKATAQELAQIALHAVLTEAPKVISGAEKFSAATSSVVTQLGSAGKQAALADIQVSVQAAYNAISASIHPVAPTP